MLPESLNRLLSRTFIPTYRLLLFHNAPKVTVLLGVPMVALLATVLATLQADSFSAPSIVGAVPTVWAKMLPAAGVAVAPVGVLVGVLVGPTGVLVRVGVFVGGWVLVGVLVGPTGVLVGVLVGATGVLVRVGVFVGGMGVSVGP